MSLGKGVRREEEQRRGVFTRRALALGMGQLALFGFLGTRLWRLQSEEGERYRTLADSARSRLKTLGYDNVEVLVADGFAGEPFRAPYDRIIVTAAAESVPDKLVEQLADDGIMLLPLGPHGGAQEIVRLTKTKDGLVREAMLPVRFVPLLPGQAREL